MARLNPAERDRRLTKRLKRELEEKGYLVKKSADSTVTVIDAKTQDVYISGVSVEDCGRIFNLWGYDPLTEEQLDQIEADAARTGIWRKPPTKDPKTGLLTPEEAAVLEQ